MSMLKYPIFITTMVIKGNIILRKIPKYFRVRGIMFPIYRKRDGKWGKI